MEKIVINGGKQLFGEINISGAKNAAVAILPATILADDICRIENLPEISDVTIMLKILQNLGADIKYINKNTLEIDTRHITSCEVSDEYAKNLRASYYLIGALLGKYKSAEVKLPGGCNIGTRAIDQHLKGFKALGAKDAETARKGFIWGGILMMPIGVLAAFLGIVAKANYPDAQAALALPCRFRRRYRQSGGGRPRELH